MTLTEIFESLCPYYMLYGMTWKEYWYGTPWMARDYKEAYYLKRRAANENLWLQGAYIRSAVESVIVSSFGGKRSEYERKPYDLFPKTHAEKQAEIENERQKLIDYLNSVARKHKQGVEKNGKP